MLWVPLIIFVAIAASLCVFIDNYISDVFFKGRRPHAQKIIGVFSYSLIALVSAIIFPPIAIPILFISIFILAGVLSSIGSIPYYNALSAENSTAAAIFIQLSPILYLIAGTVFLDETISHLQIAAFLLVLTAPLIIILSARKNQQRLQLKAAIFFTLYVVFNVAANLLFVSYSKQTEFSTAFFWYVIGKFATDLTLSLIFKSWRIRFRHVLQEYKTKFVLSTFISQITGILVEVVYRVALSLAPVAIVSVAANSLQLIATFILGIIFTLIWPNFGREKLDKKTISVHLIAIILAITGIIFMQ